MLSYVKGELVAVTTEGVVVDNQGIGYELKVPLSVMNGLPSVGTLVKMHVYLYVREDALQLYGFLDADDLDMFKLLIGVSGIGPKGALGVLSALPADDLRFAILSDDVKSISSAPGIGKKTAGKLILELKDKMKLGDVFEKRLPHAGDAPADGAPPDASLARVKNEVVEALVALGYSPTEAMRAVGQAGVAKGVSVEEALKRSLKHII